MIEFHQDERSFWKELNPARFHLLAGAYIEYRLESRARAADRGNRQTPDGAEGIRADGKWGNLRDYLRGG